MLPFTYDEFGEWYDRYAREFLVPARLAAEQALTQSLDRELREPERPRIQVRPGRVKSKGRTWQKLAAKYADRVQSTDDIRDCVTDLVGLRVVCTNRSDVDRVIELIEALPSRTEGELPVLATYPDSVDDYRTSKPSGYRAYHVSLCAAVAFALERHPITCELQVRTLLQDGWGELTHEDTYKPGTEVPGLVEILSRRMADLMATLDDIAQDLRDHMDRLAEDAADEGGSAPPTDLSSSNLAPVREAAYRFLSDRIESLDRPIDLASLAWEVRREFGEGVISGWLDHNSFKDLVMAAVPGVRVSAEPPAYVLPHGFSADSFPTHDTSDAPRAARLLKETDRSFPLVGPAQWGAIYHALGEASRAVNWTEIPQIHELNRWTREARDTDIARDRHIPRRQLDYVAKALLLARELAPDLSAEKIRDVFVEWTRARATPMDLSPNELSELRDWLGGS